MGHSIGDGIIVIAIVAGIIGQLYLKHRDRMRRLEVIHQERLAAMEKGIPLPELPIDPPRAPAAAPDRRSYLLAALVLTSIGGGGMLAFQWIEVTRPIWPLPLPLMLVGIGFFIYYAFLVTGKDQ